MKRKKILRILSFKGQSSKNFEYVVKPAFSNAHLENLRIQPDPDLKSWMKVCQLYEGVLLAEDGGEEAGGDHEWDEGNDPVFPMEQGWGSDSGRFERIWIH